MLATVTTLFVSLVIGALGVEVVKRYAPGFAGNDVAAYVLSIAVSLLGVFVFVLAIYRVLTNAPVTVRDVLPGALMAAILLETSFQIVPVFVRFAGVNPVLRVLGGPVILLLWLYLMANIIVLGAELNWWQSERRGVRTDTRMLDSVE
jgi:membrane protein